MNIETSNITKSMKSSDATNASVTSNQVVNTDSEKSFKEELLSVKNQDTSKTEQVVQDSVNKNSDTPKKDLAAQDSVNKNPDKIQKDLAAQDSVNKNSDKNQKDLAAQDLVNKNLAVINENENTFLTEHLIHLDV